MKKINEKRALGYLFVLFTLLSAIMIVFASSDASEAYIDEQFEKNGILMMSPYKNAEVLEGANNAAIAATIPWIVATILCAIIAAVLLRK